MSDILEKSLERLRDRSGAPMLEDPDSLLGAVMEATEPAVRPLWPLVLRACISSAAVVLLIAFVGLQSQPAVKAPVSDDCRYELSATHLIKSLEIAKEYNTLKNKIL